MALGALLIPLSLTAQGKCPVPPAFKALRYDENYSYLKDRACRQGPLDSFKFVPLNRSETVWASFGGEVRQRVEGLSHPIFGGTPDEADAYSLQRYLVHSDIHFGKHFRAFVQLKSALEFGRDQGPRPIDRNKLDGHQGFLDIMGKGKYDVTLRAGRQEMALGTQRLVSFAEGPNTRAAFDGLRLTVKKAAWQLDGFATRPVSQRLGIFDDIPDPRRMFWGVYLTTPVRFLEKGGVDLYYLGLDNKSARFDQGMARELRHSFGVRVFGRPNRWDYNYEALMQTGTFGSGAIRAWTMSSDDGYTFTETRFRPRIGVKANIASGDQDANHPDLQTFNPLFPTGSYFGPDGFFGPANFIDLRPSLRLEVAKAAAVTFVANYFWRQSTHDAFYQNSGAIAKSGQNSSERYSGSRHHVDFEWQLNRNWYWYANYTYFQSGPFLQGHDHIHYGTSWIAYKF